MRLRRQPAPPRSERRARVALGAVVLAAHGAVMAWALQGGGSLSERLRPPVAAPQPALVYLDLTTAPTHASALADHPPAAGTARATPPGPAAQPRPQPARSQPPLEAAAPQAPLEAPRQLTPPAASSALTLAAATTAPAARAALAAPPAEAASSPARALAGNALPAYPEAAREDGLQGHVQLQLQIDTQGQVVAVQWLRRSGIALLDHAARDALQHWRFEPARVGGQAVPGSLTLTVRFQLDAPVSATALAAR